MTWLRLSEIAKMTGGVLHGEDRQVNSVSTDSKTIQHDQLFIALVGENFDAHDFVASIENKAAAVFVHKKMDCDIPQIIVKDTLKSLGVFSAVWRQQFVKPIIGLTGSNGKTTVKEMLATILAIKGNVMATFGNLNNDIGMPLTLLRLRDDMDYAVIEMGANHFDEINYLSQIAQPDIAILNNAGAAHLEGFGNIEGVSRAKAEIFNGLNQKGIAVINADDQYADYWLACNKGRKTITFGFSGQADIKGKLSHDGLLIQIANQKQLVKLTLLGHHNAMNALAASAAAMAIGLDLTTIKQGLESLHPVKGRLAPIAGIQGIQIIDDTYNANPDSARAAIDVLAEQKESKRILVLGDMAELGDNTTQLHADIGLYAKTKGIETLYCLGPHSQYACEKFTKNGFSFDSMEPLLATLQQSIEQTLNAQQSTGDQQRVAILVKGSRSMKMERVIEVLSHQYQKTHCTNVHNQDNTMEVSLC